MNWPFPRLLAHRGGGRLAPENTLAAFATGLAHGFVAAECDVMLSRDDQPFLMHDPERGRTVSGTGPIDALTLDALQSLDAGSSFAPRFAGEPVPDYRDVLAYAFTHGIWLNVELKPCPGRAESTGRIVAQVTATCLVQHPLPVAAHMPLFSSFDSIALQAARQAAPHIPRGLLFEALPDDWQQRAQALDVRSIHLDHRHLSAEQCAAIHAAGYTLMCYTVNDPARARQLWQWGVDALCTDALDARAGLAPPHS